MSIQQNNAQIISTCSQRITALNKLVDPKTPMKINGQPMTQAEVVAVYQHSIDTRSELSARRVAFDKALDARDSAEITRHATDKALNAWITAEFGAGSQEAQELGFLPRKVAAVSALDKATAVKKTLATRQARHTLGKRQKQKIKGSIEVSSASEAPADHGAGATPSTNASSSNGTSNAAHTSASNAAPSTSGSAAPN